MGNILSDRWLSVLILHKNKYFMSKQKIEAFSAGVTEPKKTQQELHLVDYTKIIEFNILLKEGWRVVEMTPTGATGDATVAVLIEKE